MPQLYRPMPQLFGFTGPVSRPLWHFRNDTPDQPIVPEDEQQWLRENPKQVGRIHRREVLSDPELKLIVPTFVFSVRMLDDREPEGWRYASFYLPGVASYSWDAEQSLEDVWPSFKGDPTKENEFLLTALDEAAYTGESWAEAVIRSLALPDPSLLDPERWGLDFTPVRTKP